MRIALDEVRRIARLAQLEFGQQELESLRGDLDQILTYIEQLQEIDTEGVEAAIGMHGGGSGGVERLREDELQGCLSPEEALANAPESAGGHFKVPKVIP
ncbi:MAG TPA: Asp-tRNA(Asn)/Glu-tRNA(Gln) amidotransferase subunit GatC [Candidatus Polarisedimenticolia bacterium]|nr:Asp-tRNA(Asn)/Glu-tRNA(Gln) amidotransferase subunit GatC [Candidatus Polarisedimenticolia bacterium]